MFRLDLEARTAAKRLALDEGVVEEKSELLFSGGKDDWQRIWETTLAIDQKEQETACQEAILLLTPWTKDDLAFFVMPRSIASVMKEAKEEGSFEKPEDQG